MIDVVFEEAGGAILWTTFLTPPMPSRGDYVDYLGQDYLVLRRIFEYAVETGPPTIRIILEEVP